MRRKHFYGLSLLSVIFYLLVFEKPVAWADVNLTITLRDGAIEPATFQASKGNMVHIHVINQGKGRHNLVIPDFYIFTQNLNAGETVDASFKPDKLGDFPYYSDKGGKPELGIRGTLTVS
jgi:plastocyanin